MWSNLPVIYRGAMILAVPIISFIPAIATWIWSYEAKSEAQQWVSHTEKVLRETTLLMKNIVDAETGIRGYAITRKSEFLEPYLEAQTEIPVLLSAIKELTADNPSQQLHLKQTEEQIKTRLSLLVQILNQLQTQPDSNVIRSSQLTQLLTKGRIEMDRIRQSIETFSDEEWRLFNLRQQKLAQIETIRNVALGISIFSIILGYGLAIKLYLQSEEKLEFKAKKLEKINQNLNLVNQLLEERNQELDQFTYIVSHDLKAPLRGITNLSEWIEEDLEGKLDPDTSQNMSLLRNRVQRMNNFIDGLLAYSRADKSQEAKTTVDVQKLLDEIIDSLAPPPNFKIDISSKMPVLQTEALPLQQVFSNLISNGIKHHHRDDGIIQISAIEQGKYYQFAVSDDGLGIAPEDQAKIFTIFKTLSVKDTKENTGIGLSIVKKIVEHQGGKVWLESKLNQGTTFYFTWSSG
ncbi:CHASE3 domain-containing protein [Pleurocapsa sp. CCALA 161]|uniref:sensor histidine kinase n=1 Tax=Pleurocapsa sp. CCALA 161 TaxID=2107688 RepID=UPI0018EDD2B9|nr:sensor histidine kinase [Pleurocapsa sp. CCALA 161]